MAFKMPELEWGLLSVMVAGVVVKLATSKRLTFRSGTATAIVSIFCGYVFTDPIANWFSVTDQSMRYAICGLVVLTGEGFVRFIIDVTSSTEDLKNALRDVFQIWRGK